MNDVMERISSLLTTRFGVPTTEFRPDATLLDLDLDSLALVEFSLVAEEEFGVRISEDDISPDDTVGTLAELITTRGVAA